MKRLLIAAAIATASIATPSFAADVGVSVSIGQPGFYGRLDVGDYPQPQTYYRQPRIIQRSDYEGEPVYLRVPPGNRRHWAQHCNEYDACNERVYFVQDNWYNREYAPRYQEQHRDHHDGGYDGRGNNDHENQGNDHHGDDHRGNGHDRGHDRH